MVVGVVALGAVAAACGGGDDDGGSGRQGASEARDDRASEQADEQAVEQAEDQAVAQADEPAQAEEQAEEQAVEQAEAQAEAPAPAGGVATFAGADQYGGSGRFDWRVVRVDQGVKPDIALDGEGRPLVAYMLERLGQDGWVRVATGVDGSFTTTDLQRGYFYGPLDLEVSADGVAAVGYHNHDWEDGAIAVQDGDAWQLRRIVDEGHDGWDSALAFGADGSLHFLGVDPSQFGSQDGVEHATLVNDEWQVTPVGSGPQPYEWGTDIAIDADGGLHAVYFEAGERDLVYATNAGSGWTLETIYSDGDAGRFAVLNLAADGTPHVAFFQSPDGVPSIGPASGFIIYGTVRDGVWGFETIGEVGEGHFVGFEDARRTVAIAMHEDAPTVAWIDRSQVSIAALRDGVWEAEQVLASGEAEFQVVGLALDASGAPHLTFSTVTHNPLDGDVWYVAPVARG